MMPYLVIDNYILCNANNLKQKNLVKRDRS